MKTFMAMVLCISSVIPAFSQPSRVNFNHLDHLTEKIQLLGDSVSVVHVYANYPDYKWVGAAESGLEGIACVDDAARAAVMYLRHYESTKNEDDLLRAKSLLKFVMKMETDDGMFYNFILKDHSINKNGNTSFRSFGWWASRGVWCMSAGYRILKDIEPAFAESLKQHIERTFPHIDSLFINYNQFRFVDRYRIPKWLLYDSGTDVTSELMLGLVEYYSATHDPKVMLYIRKFADGLMAMQDGTINKYPYGLHRSWQTKWHMWGNGQTQALASAGRLLNDSRMIRSAEREAKGFYSRLLVEGFKKEMDLTDTSATLTYEQIAYAVRPMAVGLIRLYEATGKILYLKMAGLAASWLFGNNILNQAMYDTATGRCYDGIRDSISVNRNSGAESTIEALSTIVEMEQYPPVNKYLDYKRVRYERAGNYLYGVFQNDAHDELTLVIDLKNARTSILEGVSSNRFLSRIRKR